jgi:hypothetical protein
MLACFEQMSSLARQTRPCFPGCNPNHPSFWLWIAVSTCLTGEAGWPPEKVRLYEFVVSECCFASCELGPIIIGALPANRVSCHGTLGVGWRLTW